MNQTAEAGVLSVSVPDTGGAFASVTVFHLSREDSPCGRANVQQFRHPFLV